MCGHMEHPPNPSWCWHISSAGARWAQSDSWMEAGQSSRVHLSACVSCCHLKHPRHIPSPSSPSLFCHTFFLPSPFKRFTDFLHRQRVNHVAFFFLPPTWIHSLVDRSMVKDLCCLNIKRSAIIETHRHKGSENRSDIGLSVVWMKYLFFNDWRIIKGKLWVWGKKQFLIFRLIEAEIKWDI